MNIFLSIVVVLGVGFGLAVLLARHMARTCSYNKTTETARVKDYEKATTILFTILFGFMLLMISMGIAGFAPTEKILIRQTELTATRTTDFLFLYNEEVKTVLIYKDGSAADITTLYGKLNIGKGISQYMKITENIETAVMEEYIIRIPETTYTRYVPFASLAQERETLEVRVPPGTIIATLTKTAVK